MRDPARIRRCVLSCATLLVASVVAAAPASGPKLGARMPAFTLPEMRGWPLSLADVTEPVIVLNFWAFWCDTWKAQLPQLRELAGKQGELGFRLIAISVDGSWTDVFRRHCPKGVPFPVLLDRRSTLAHALGLRKVPTVIVLDRQRIIRYVHEAYPGNLVVLQAIRNAAGGA